MGGVVGYSLPPRSIREISARVRSIAQETIVVAKMHMAAHVAQSIGASILNSTIIGAISVAKVQNSPNIKNMSPAFTNTASRNIYLDFGRGSALA